MKYFWILPLVVIASCGKVDGTAGSQLEPIKNASRLVAGNELNGFTKICAALSNKKKYLADRKNTEYIFSGSTKNCTDTAFAQLPDSKTMLIEQSGKLQFNEGISAAYFSDPETVDSGIYTYICSNLGNLISPVSTDGINYVHFSTDVGPSDCAAVADQECVKIQKGVKKTVDKVEMTDIQTTEWTRFKLDANYQDLIGFWTYKKRISKAGCVDGYNFSRTATLK
jgi:hypothetical protein